MIVATQAEDYWPMIQNADTVAKRTIQPRSAGRVRAREPGRTAAAQQAGKFNDEIVRPDRKSLFDRGARSPGTETVTLTRDEGNRPDTNMKASQS